MKLKICVLALIVLCLFSRLACAANVCGVLNNLEVEAALRGPGKVAFANLDLNVGKASVCTYKRATGGPFTTIAALAAAPGPSIFLVVTDPGVAPAVDPKTMDSEEIVPALGDRATVIRGPVDKNSGTNDDFRVAVITGSQSYMLLYHPAGPDPRAKETAVQRAREVLLGRFNGNLTSFPIADLVLANDKKEVVQKPDNIELWNEIGLFSNNLKRYQDARDAYSKISQLLPNDPGGYYGVALADWDRSYPQRMELRAKLGMPAMVRLALDPAHKEECAAARRDFRPIIDEGYSNARKALELQPHSNNYAAIASLLARDKADTDCDDPQAVRTDTGDADHLAELANNNRKAETNGEKYPESRIAVSPYLIGPPPPPPPPPPSGTPMGGGVLGSVLGSTAVNNPGVSTAGRVLISAAIEGGLLVNRVSPIYPTLARKARIQGTVNLKGVIDKEGSVQSLELISGHPMLVPAAIDAVKQWKYKPYLLNGEPVMVETTIQVNFSLQNAP